MGACNNAEPHKNVVGRYWLAAWATGPCINGARAARSSNSIDKQLFLRGRPQLNLTKHQPQFYLNHDGFLRQSPSPSFIPKANPGWPTQRSIAGKYLCGLTVTLVRSPGPCTLLYKADALQAMTLVVGTSVWVADKLTQF
jgi:hypothetical protein